MTLNELHKRYEKINTITPMQEIRALTKEFDIEFKDIAKMLDLDDHEYIRMLFRLGRLHLAIDEIIIAKLIFNTIIVHTPNQPSADFIKAFSCMESIRIAELNHTFVIIQSGYNPYIDILYENLSREYNVRTDIKTMELIVNEYLDTTREVFIQKLISTIEKGAPLSPLQKHYPCLMSFITILEPILRKTATKTARIVEQILGTTGFIENEEIKLWL